MWHRFVCGRPTLCRAAGSNRRVFQILWSPSERSVPPTIVGCRQFSSTGPLAKKGEVFGSIYRPHTYPIGNDEVANSIRCSLSGYNFEDQDFYGKDTGLSIMFLGTSAGIPTKTRSTTSTLLRLDGSSYLFDAGEGVQRQIAFTRAKPSQIQHIFITHMHGDHIFGLPGFLLGLQHTFMLMQSHKANNGKKTQPDAQDHVVKIYGPPGLYNYVASTIVLSCTTFHSIHVEVHELVGGKVRRAHGTRNQRNPFDAHYPELDSGRLSRKVIPCEDGVWKIQDFPKQISREEVLAPMKGRRQGENRRVRIQAAEVDHLSGIATFGFVFEEDEPPRNLDVTKAKELGVSPQGKKYELLKYGFSVQADDGTTTVRPEQVLKPPTKKARKVAIIGDNRAWTNEMRHLAKDSDVLVHEATLTEQDWTRGHSTAHMAGKVCRDVNASLLVLNHISGKIDQYDENGDSEGHLQVIEKAKVGCGRRSEVLLAYDFMEILLPWMGFGQSNSDAVAGTKEVLSDDVEVASKVDGGKRIAASEVLSRWFGSNHDTNQ